MRRILVAALIGALLPGAGAASGSKTNSVPGYEAVPIHYGWNMMLMDAAVNGKKARLAIDTGSSFSVFDESRARAFGISPVGAHSAYPKYAMINRESHRIAYIKDLRAGPMDFGGGPIVLFSPSRIHPRSHLPGADVDGMVGADILTRYKAVINCLTQVVYFKTESSAHLRLVSFLAEQHFTRVPMREEVSRGFTVPASINGHSCRLLVDTGGANTLFNEEVTREFGLSFRGSRLTMSFADGVARKVRVGKVSNLMIGDFPIPPQNLAAAALPAFAIEHGGNVHVAGIIGMELLALNRGIIDFDSMNLFLK